MMTDHFTTQRLDALLQFAAQLQTAIYDQDLQIERLQIAKAANHSALSETNKRIVDLQKKAE
jgi:hypothetical protein